MADSPLIIKSKEFAWQIIKVCNYVKQTKMHRGTTRYLKCPKCHKRTWCKKGLKKSILICRLKGFINLPDKRNGTPKGFSFWGAVPI